MPVPPDENPENRGGIRYSKTLHGAWGPGGEPRFASEPITEYIARARTLAGGPAELRNVSL